MYTFLSRPLCSRAISFLNSPYVEDQDLILLWCRLDSRLERLLYSLILLQPGLVISSSMCFPPVPAYLSPIPSNLDCIDLNFNRKDYATGLHCSEWARNHRLHELIIDFHFSIAETIFQLVGLK